MAIMRRCCCCGVRGGSTASGWYTLVIGTLLLGTFGYAYSASEVWEKWVDDGSTVRDQDGNIVMQLDEFSTKQASDVVDKVKTFLLVFTIFSGCLILSSLVLLGGICADKPYTFIPWIICTAIMAILHLADGIYLVVLTGGLTAMIIHLAIMLLFVALDVYCILCVVSHFQNLRQGITGLEPPTTMVVIQQGQQPPGYEPPPKC